MDRDPYSMLIKAIRQEGSKFNPPSIILAEVTHVKVTSKGLTELKVKFNNIEVDQRDILVADYLLPKYKRRYRIPKQSGNEDTGAAQYSHFSFNTADLDLINAGNAVNDDNNTIAGNYTETATGTTEMASVTNSAFLTNGHDHNHNFTGSEVSELINNNPFASEGHLFYTDTLRRGDLVAVVPTYDRQKYFILARVVKMG